jgi:hypothetical protein
LLTDRLRVLGPDHPDTCSSRESLAYWQERLAGSPSTTQQSPRCTGRHTESPSPP